MLGFSFSCLTAWGSDLARTVVCGRRGCKGKEGKGWERKGKEGKGWERNGKDGKWVRRTARTAADGVGARGWLEMGGEKKPLW